ncbi:ROK family protein [Enterococcus sp. AZ109]|uniref:ROK family protein n=1 Tax=Enterococcus sp. AZ109 TaxID=2774634 RepID=UPI003F22A5EF
MISSKYTIREQNEAIILQTIIQQEEISRADLASQTGLNKASVSAITKKLLEDQLILETRIGDASNAGGRKPIMLTLNRRTALVIAMDIGYNYIEAMLSYIDGTIVKKIEKKRLSITKANVLAEIETIIKPFMQAQPETPHGIVGLALAVHGVVDQDRPVFTPYYDLDQIDLKHELQLRYSFPIFVQNEANLAALGEYAFSSQYQSLVSLSIHSGVGSGIVESGELQLGKQGQAGEIGHTILFPHGKQCPCGNEGCLEQYASNKVMYADFAEKKQLDYVNSEILAAHVEQNDPLAVELVHENATYLSIGINNIVMLYDPDVVVINSSLYRRLPQLIETVTHQLKSQFAKDIVITNTSLEGNATLYGALAVATQHFLNVKQLKIRVKN